MNLKTDTILDNLIEDKKLHELKASEITKVKKERQALGMLGCLSYIAIFPLIVSITALIIWFNKFTLFVAIVVFLVNITMFGLTFFQYRETIKLVNNIVKRVNNIK